MKLSCASLLIAMNLRALKSLCDVVVVLCPDCMSPVREFPLLGI